MKCKDALERDIEEYFVKRVKESGGLQRKFKSPGHRGVPDRICAFSGGIIVLVELKAPGGHPREEQIREHNRWKKLGVPVYVISEKSQVDDLINKLKNT